MFSNQIPSSQYKPSHESELTNKDLVAEVKPLWVKSIPMFMLKSCILIQHTYLSFQIGFKIVLA